MGSDKIRSSWFSRTKHWSFAINKEKIYGYFYYWNFWNQSDGESSSSSITAAAELSLELKNEWKNKFKPFYEKVKNKIKNFPL